MQSPLFYIKNPHTLISRLLEKYGKGISDELYLKCFYKNRFHRKLDLTHPKTFNEKLNWLKLYDRNPLYTLMADKYEVKRIVSEIIGNEYVVENIVVANRWEDIDFDKLPNQFVIKGTHNSGGVFVCRDKSHFDFKLVRSKMEKSQKNNWFWHTREWPYKDIKPRIIVDCYLDDGTGKELRDYKWWCFNGKPMFMYCTIKSQEIYENFYDMDFQPVMIDHGFPRHLPEFERPIKFDLMKELATKLSKNIPFVRVDFFQVGEKVYFGEFTFYDWGGMRPFGGDWDEKLGEYIILPKR